MHCALIVKVALLENVVGLMMNHGRVLERVEDTLTAGGYAPCSKTSEEVSWSFGSVWAFNQSGHDQTSRAQGCENRGRQDLRARSQPAARTCLCACSPPTLPEEVRVLP